MWKTHFSRRAALCTLALATLPAAHATDIQTRNLKIPVVTTLDHPQGAGAVKFAELLEKKSGGKIKARVFPNGTLGGEVQVVSALQGGTIEATVTSTAVLVGIAPQFALMDFPFQFRNDKEAAQILDGKVGDTLFSKLTDKGLVGLAYMDTGFRQVTNSKHALTKLEDFAGLKLRAPQNPIYIDFVRALGANAVPLPLPELYTALETRALDGQENGNTTTAALKIDEVQNYLSMTNHIYNAQTVLVSGKLWQSLSEDEKTIFREAAFEARDAQRQAAQAAEQKALKMLNAGKIKITYFAPEEIARLRAATASLRDKYADQIGQDLVALFDHEIQRIRTQSAN